MRRHIRRILLALILGVVTTVLVAWGCALGVEWDETRTYESALALDGENYTSWKYTAYNQPGRFAAWSGIRTQDYLVDRNGDTPPVTEHHPRELVPPWATSLNPPGAGVIADTRVMAVEASGWPYLAMWSRHTYLLTFSTVPSGGGSASARMATLSALDELQYGIPLNSIPTGQPMGYFQQALQLPLVPIGRGFTLNTLFYAALIWVILTFWSWGRSVARRGVGRCGRCAYDLRASTGAVCPECGSVVNLARVGTPFARWQRRGVLTVGGLGIACLVGALGYGGWQMLPEIDWQRMKPNGWLVWRANSTDPETANAMLTEIIRRHRVGDFTDSDFQQLIDEALAIQADRTLPWVTGWGDVIVAGRAHDLVDDEAWNSYFANAISLTISSRKQVRGGDRMPLFLDLDPRSSAVKPIWVEIDKPIIRIDGRPYGGSSSSGRNLSERERHFDLATLLSRRWNSVPRSSLDPPDAHRIEVQGKVHLYEDRPAIRTWPMPPAQVSDDFLLKTTIDVGTADCNLIEFVDREDWRTQILNELSASAWYSPTYGLEVHLYSRQLTVPCAFEVGVRIGGLVYDLEPFTSKTSISFREPIELAESPGDTIDLLLTPSSQVARERLLANEIYGKPIILEDIDVTPR